MRQRTVLRYSTNYLNRYVLSDIFILYSAALAIIYSPRKSQENQVMSDFWRETWIKIMVPLAFQKTIRDSKNAHTEWQIDLRAVSKSETQCNLQFSTLWLLFPSKGLLLNSIVSLILQNQTPNWTSVYVDSFFNLDWMSKSFPLRQRKQEKKGTLSFHLGMVPGSAIALISPWVTLVPSTCQTFPFWMPEEKLLFDNGMLESDEETIQLYPAQ